MKETLIALAALFLSLLGIDISQKDLQEAVQIAEETATYLNYDAAAAENSTASASGRAQFESAANLETALITRIVDGDTVELSDGRKLRYIGIDTPETKHPSKPVGCYGQEASVKNSELVLGRTVQLEKDVSDTDRYGRLLRYVWLDGEMINEKLVAEGFARVSTYPPDVKYQEIFQVAAAAAREKSLGLWDPATCP